ncbi:MAG: hypothetical protein CME68_07005 [Halobacteriovoraceae bacterium]|nr:hypothetical protein [Halobacteriovoraceae bacterium]
MNRLIITILFIFLPLSSSLSQEGCDEEIGTLCEPDGLNLENCLKEKSKAFSKTCYKKLMDRTSQEVGANDSCAQEIQNLCTEEESVEECLRLKGNSLTTACREKFGTDGSPTILKEPFVKKIVDNCMGDIKKLCPFNEKIIGKNPTKAIQDYQACVKNSLPKVNKKCKSVMEGKKKKKDTIQTLE